MESFFSHLKTEGLYPFISERSPKHKTKLRNTFCFYNRKRPQRKLKKLTLVEYRRQFSA
ncbi:IS3 family transposase [Paenibacillus vortex]|uniref:IS3 family transposase n=1 Tax=Paenibacillus vortex TaxID=71995 RepID=UPI000C1C9717